MAVRGRVQQVAIPVVGYRHASSMAGRENQAAAFRQGLAEVSFTGGCNVLIE